MKIWKQSINKCLSDASQAFPPMSYQLKSNQQISQQPFPIHPLIQIFLCSILTPDSHYMPQFDHADSASRTGFGSKRTILTTLSLKIAANLIPTDPPNE